MDIRSYIEDPFVFEKRLNKYLARDDELIIFEIGSCEGEDSIRLKKAYPNSTIYTFEPLPKNVKKIKSNFKRYGISTQHVYPLALSDKDGVSSFFVSSGHPPGKPNTTAWDYGNKSSSLLPPKKHKNIHEWVKFNQQIDVPTMRLDTFCAKHGIEKIDFIYLDVQGAELMVLQGAGEMIKKVGAIWMEVEAVELYAKQPLKKDVEEFMKRHGFKLLMDTVNRVSGDQLYVNSSLNSSWFNKIISKYVGHGSS